MRLGEPRDDLNQDARWRIAEWVRYYRERFRSEYPKDAAFAAKLSLSPPTLTNILKGTRPAGLETLLRMRTAFRVDAESVFSGPPPWHKLGLDRPPDPRGLPHGPDDVADERRHPQQAPSPGQSGELKSGGHHR